MLLLLLLLPKGLTLFACVCVGIDVRRGGFILNSSSASSDLPLPYMPFPLPTTHSTQPDRSHTSLTQSPTSSRQRDGAREAKCGKPEGKRKTTDLLPQPASSQWAWTTPCCWSLITITPRDESTVSGPFAGGRWGGAPGAGLVAWEPFRQHHEARARDCGCGRTKPAIKLPHAGACLPSGGGRGVGG